MASWRVMSDLSNPGELLHDHVQALGALAQTLVRDRHAAEDAVQDTLVAALTSRARRTGSPWAWLRAILQNRVRHDARARRRRLARETARATPGASPSAAEVAGELQLHRRLVELVQAQSEPVRHALFLRFWCGMSPREIAEATGVPEPTVRSRIERALVRLRAELDAEAQNGGARPWAALAVLRGEPAATVGIAALGLLMKTKLLVGAAAVVVLLLLAPLFWLPLGDADPRPHGAAVAARAEAAANEPRAPAEDVSRGRVAVAKTPDVATDAATATAITAFVRDLDGRPVAGVPVTFERIDDDRVVVRDAAVAPMQSGVDGSVALQWPERPGWLTAGDSEWAAVRRAWCGRERPVSAPVVLVAPLRHYAGSVVDPSGAPAAGARVTIVLGDDLAPSRAVGGDVVALPNDLATATADDAGRFTIAVGWVAHSRLVAEQPPFGPGTAELPAAAANDLLLRLGAVNDDPRVHGIVVDADGGPASAVHVAVGGDSVRTDAAGRFAAPWLFGWRPTWVRAVRPGLGAATARLVPGDGQPGWSREHPITLRLPAAAGIVRGQVVDAEGTPVPGARVFTPDLTWFGNVTVEHRGHPVSAPSSVEGVVNDPNASIDAVLRLGTTTDADGRFELAGLLDRGYPLFAVTQPTLAAAGPLWASPGDTVELRLGRAALHRVAGRLVAEIGGAPLPGVRVAVGRRLPWQRPERYDDPWHSSPMQPADASHAFRSVTATTDAEGRFELPPMQTDGTYLTFDGEVLFAAPPFRLPPGPPFEELGIALPARSTFHLEVADPEEADAFWIADADGRQLPLFVRVEGAVMSMWRVGLVAGRSPAAYCRAGEVTFVLEKGGAEVRRIDATLLAGTREVRL
ncbi:MAG: sigma-70 family RNA polymerase sigma factor [Planctomycetes bacterium]|nr:sigma-70 family RNA polymerase sigma factor [Planctomycetota bacterium]